MKILALLLILYSLPCMAGWTTEVDTGGLTYHLFGDTTNSQNYVGKLADAGNLIFNPLIGYKLTDEFSPTECESYTVFSGHNSVGGAIGGGIYSFGSLDGPLQLGVAVGAYKQDDAQFTNAGVSLPLNDINGYVLLAGFEANYRWMLSDKDFIKINSYLFPGLINMTVGFGGYF